MILMYTQVYVMSRANNTTYIYPLLDKSLSDPVDIRSHIGMIQEFSL